MAIKQSLWQRPLLVGGIGLSVSLGILETTHLIPLDGSTLMTALALGSGLWWWRQRRSPGPSAPRPVAAPVVDRPRVEAQLAELGDLLSLLKAESAPPQTAGPALVNPQARIATYEAQRQALAVALDRTQLRGLVVGERYSGKSTLLQHLTGRSASLPPAAAGPPGQPPDPPISVIWREGYPQGGSLVEVTRADSPAATPQTMTPSALPLAPSTLLEDTDLVLWVTDGDITASALAQLRQHVIAGRGVILAFNKTDHYPPADRHQVITQLQRQGETLPGPVAVVAVAADPRPITVRRHRADGGMEESQEGVPPQMAALETALAEVMQQAPTLVAATTLRQAEALRQCIQHDLNQVRRQRAMPLIDQLQWVAAAAAFANPIPSLDMLATLAINGQLIMDLGKLYGFNLSLEEAKTAATTLAGLTVKLGLVELSTQVLTGVLKGHFATYLAGGMVQGLSAAYLTRMAGLSLIDYFEQAALAGTPTQALSWEAIAQRLATVIQQNRQIALLQNLVKQGIGILKPAPNVALMTATAPPPISLATPEPLIVQAEPPRHP